MAAFLEAELPSQPTPELQDSVAVNHEERTKLFNAGKMLDPVVQVRKFPPLSFWYSAIV